MDGAPTGSAQAVTEDRAVSEPRVSKADWSGFGDVIWMALGLDKPPPPPGPLVRRLSPQRRVRLGLTYMRIGLLSAAFAVAWAWTSRQEFLHVTAKSAAATHKATVGVQAATVEVQVEVKRLAEETARAQRLAIWIGVGTAALGAVLGGFAGAFAVRILGN
jgi:hypothetical protein